MAVTSAPDSGGSVVDDEEGPRQDIDSVQPFPAGSGGGVSSDIDGVILVFPATLDTQSPLFTRAAAACRLPLRYQ
jgi:hypothetical protein